MSIRSTRLIASVTAGSTEELLRIVRSGTAGADVVELRVDAVTSPDLAALVEGVEAPSILTCRSASEGGRYQGTEASRLDLLERAASHGFDYIDVEIDALDKPFPKHGAKLILSHHGFQGLPSDPDRLVSDALGMGADVVKIAARVDSLAEAITLARLGDKVRAAGKGFVPVALGPSGVAARILANRLRGDFMYAAARGGEATGPGQLSIDEMLGLYRFASIGPHTEIYGILGSQVLSSRSPTMHNSFFASIGRDAVYVPFQEKSVDGFVGAAREIGVKGLSVTMPFKETIVPFLDEIDEVAARVGAVNTVVVRDGRWRGSNTDIMGVLEPLRALGDLKGRKTVLVGAGGAARAAAFALAQAGTSLRVLARRRDRAEALARKVEAQAGTFSELETATWDLLVNATPIGADGEGLEVAAIDSESWVFDMVTTPELTPLIRKARAAGAKTVTGLEMLAAQAVHQQALWTGQRSTRAAMEAAVRSISERSRYSRQILFKDIGEEGQRLISSRRVLVVGVGALGSVSSEMIARAGVQAIRIVDRDYVEESNLQRQSLFDENDWREGLPKAVAASRKLTRINSGVAVEAVVADLHAGNVLSLLEETDLVLDGTDNFETRYLLNDASIKSGIPWIYAACVGSYGMSFVVIPGRTPCLRCFMEEEPAPGTSPTCDTAGVIAPVVHAVAAFQVTEALKLLSGREDTLRGEILSLDVWRGAVDSFRPASKRLECPACGRREWSYLDGIEGSQAVTLCGRNAVQVRPSKTQTMDLADIASRLSKLGKVSVNAYLLRVNLDELELVLFKDGRAIVHGTEDAAEARGLYARYVGS